LLEKKMPSPSMSPQGPPLQASPGQGPQGQPDLLGQMSEWYQQALKEGDERVMSWPLMNPIHCLGLTTAYLLGLYVVVQIMKKRKEPFKLKAFATIHNINLTVLSLYMTIEVLRQALKNNYSLFGNAVDRSEKGYEMARILYIFYLSKILEFIDTYIMALKKNFHQISFLHVYHHASIFVIWWITVYYAPGGESYFSAALNSFVHVVMYSYYLWSGLSSGKSKTSKPTWREAGYYKQYITTLQMGQFCIMLIQSCYDLYVPNGYRPLFCVKILFFYMLTMLLLFSNFFFQAYLAKGKKPRGDDPKGNQMNGDTNHKPPRGKKPRKED